MSQRDVLQQATNLFNTLRGPAKILYATFNAAIPSVLQQAINVTTGAPVTPWVSFGLTRGGIAVHKNLTITARDDVDQIYGVFDQDVTAEAWTLASQVAEVLDRTQMGMVLDMGVPTFVSATSGDLGTQVMVPLESGRNKTLEWRLMAIYPKSTAGKFVAFVFRRAALAGGDMPFLFDQTNPASPPLNINVMPEISTTISADQAFGAFYAVD